MSNFWSKHTELVSVDKNKKEVIKAFSCERQEKEYIELRIFTRESEEDKETKPTKKGIVVPKDMWATLSNAIEQELSKEDM